MHSNIIIRTYDSPAGKMIVGVYGDKICICDWVGDKHPNILDVKICPRLNTEYEEGTTATLDQAIRELDEYFAGNRTSFSLQPIFTGTEFQNIVWGELLKIPYGQTISYGELARRIGKPKAVRAVAAANSRNPISIIVPCHRVIGSNNKLIGYSGGLAAKSCLLNVERSHLAPSLPFGNI